MGKMVTFFEWVRYPFASWKKKGAERPLGELKNIQEFLKKLSPLKGKHLTNILS